MRARDAIIKFRRRNRSAPGCDGQRLPGRVLEKRHPLLCTGVIKGALVVFADHVWSTGERNTLLTQRRVRSIDVVNPEIDYRGQRVRIRFKHDPGPVEVKKDDPRRVIHGNEACAKHVAVERCERGRVSPGPCCTASTQRREAYFAINSAMTRLMRQIRRVDDRQAVGRARL